MGRDFVPGSRRIRILPKSLAVGSIVPALAESARAGHPLCSCCLRHQKAGPPAVFSVVPTGLGCILADLPRTYVLGYLMPPLRGSNGLGSGAAPLRLSVSTDATKEWGRGLISISQCHSRAVMEPLCRSRRRLQGSQIRCRTESRPCADRLPDPIGKYWFRARASCRERLGREQKGGPYRSG